MKHPLRTLEDELQRIQGLLNQDTFLSLGAEEKESLRGEAERLSEKLAAVEDNFLTIGLLGGTGVGKSTLMNALAGSFIASVSHRRPHTDEVLIYGHAAVEIIPAMVIKDVPWQEIRHQIDDIRHILLCDLPDFDSLLGEHRERVLRFLEHLDLLVWITSPEKYGDGRFYEFLRLVPKAEQNFIFVLNKVDVLFEQDTPEGGHELLARISKSLQVHIQENGIERPLLYHLSAKEALESRPLEPWNQFPAFREYVFQQRDIKQITAIKAANLDVEVRQLRSVFRREVLNLEAFAHILEEVIEELREERSRWIPAVQESIDLWLQRYMRPDILRGQGDPSVLVGPGYAIAMLWSNWQNRRSPEESPSVDLHHFSPPREIASFFNRRLDWLSERLHRGLLRQNLPRSFGEKLDEVLDVTGRFTDTRDRFSQVVALGTARPTASFFRGFRALQLFAYLLLFAGLVLAIGAETAWQNVIADPGVKSLLRLIVSAIHTLFSSKGLAALGTYALLNLFFAFRFHRRYRKLLRKAAQNTMDSLKVLLFKTWEETLDAIEEDLEELKADVHTRVKTIGPGNQEAPEVESSAANPD